MINYVEDALGNVLSVGEMVIVSRPDDGSSYLTLCTLIKINDKSVSIRPVNPDGSDSFITAWNGTKIPASSFSVRKNNGSDKCVKIARYVV